MPSVSIGLLLQRRDLPRRSQHGKPFHLRCHIFHLARRWLEQLVTNEWKAVLALHWREYILIVLLVFGQVACNLEILLVKLALYDRGETDRQTVLIVDILFVRWDNSLLGFHHRILFLLLRIVWVRNLLVDIEHLIEWIVPSRHPWRPLKSIIRMQALLPLLPAPWLPIIELREEEEWGASGGGIVTDYVW